MFLQPFQRKRAVSLLDWLGESKKQDGTKPLFLLGWVHILQQGYALTHIHSLLRGINPQDHAVSTAGGRLWMCRHIKKNTGFIEFCKKYCCHAHDQCVIEDASKASMQASCSRPAGQGDRDHTVNWFTATTKRKKKIQSKKLESFIRINSHM